MPTRAQRRRARRAAHLADVLSFNEHPEARHHFRELLPYEFRRRPGRLAKELTYNVLAIRVGTGIFTTLVTLRRDHLEADRAAALQAALDELEKNGVAHGHCARRRNEDLSPTSPNQRNAEHVYPIATRSARR